MKRFDELVAARPGWVLAAVLAVTLAAAAGLVDPRSGALRLRIDPSLDRLLPEDDPARRYHERARTLFGDDETVVVALESDDLFTRGGLARVERLTRRLEALPDVHHVLSLATAPNLRAGEGGLEISSFTDTRTRGPEELARLREDVAANPLYRGRLVSEDGRMTALVVYLRGLGNRELIERGIPGRIAALAEEESGPAEVHVTGPPVVKAANARALIDSLSFALPAALILGGVVVYVAFGSLRAVLLPLAGIALAVVWMLGLLAWLGRPLNLVTAIAPPLVIAVGLAYAMHVLTAIRLPPEEEGEEEATAEGAERVRRGLASVRLPVAITGITTAAGFLALLLNPLPAVREFAAMAVAGVLFAVVLSLTFLPAALQLSGAAAKSEDPPGARLFTTAAGVLAHYALYYRRRILVAGGVLLAASLAAMTQIQVGTDYIRDFPADAPVRTGYEAVNEALGGAASFSVVVEANLNDAFVDPELLRELDALQRWIEAQPEVGAATSMVDPLRLLNRSLHDGDPEHFAIPESSALAKQLLVFGGGEEIESYVDSRFRTARVRVRTRAGDSASLGALQDRVRDRLEALPLPLRGRVTGESALVTRAVEMIARGQVLSIGAALGIIYLILAALFTSFRVGLLALLPNLLPIAVYFGALGATGVTLNPTTSLIACIALGIAVDDTLHYLVRFNTDAKRLASEEKATFAALGDVLRPVTFTTLALCLGFLALMGSELRNQVHFGALAAFTLAVAWAMDITLTPALCSHVRIVTLWDVLTLDLGDQPQRSIPLFDGLSLRQARIFALMSDILDLHAGTRLVSEGEKDDRELYVVVDGRVSAWIERDGRRIELSTLSRGAVVGEVGFFSTRRSANVEVVEDSRLLRFTREDLDRLLRRYPRTAARIYRNLNHIQADRLLREAHRERG